MLLGPAFAKYVTCTGTTQYDTLGTGPIAVRYNTVPRWLYRLCCTGCIDKIYCSLLPFLASFSCHLNLIMQPEVISLYGNHSFVSTQESLLKYARGGYHPVCLGDTFKDGRYQVCHRLGWGSFSIVWLARDTRYTTRKREMPFDVILIYLRDQRWVSIKIKTAESSTNNRELHNLQSLCQCAEGNLGHNGIVQLLDHFIHQGPNGKHQCLVFELLGPTVGEVIETRVDMKDPIPPKMILRMSKQLLRAVAFIHRVGYVHGGMVARKHYTRLCYPPSPTPAGDSWSSFTFEDCN